MAETALAEQAESVDRTAGLVGDRQLVCVQTFDIARLTSHPVALVPGSFIALGGRGPHSDSNESGKTSFLAAVSLLLGDPEWRMMGGGGATAAALLFEPDTAGVSAQTYAAARQGYVVGVFATPEDPDRSALTVWCRINATAPYFQVRWASGVHLVTGDGDRERHEKADACWDSLPRENEFGPQGYVRELFGDSPRCLAYVERRGKRHSAPSLLRMNAGGFTPEQIGDDLIRLTGRAAAFEAELEQRVRLDEAERSLRENQLRDAQARHTEDEALQGVNARDEARAALAEAEAVWRLHFARGLLDAVEKEQGLQAEGKEVAERLEAEEAEVASAEKALEHLQQTDELVREYEQADREYKRLHGEMDDARTNRATSRARADQARERVRELDDAADNWRGPSADECDDLLTEAREAYGNSQRQLGVARDNHERAAAALATAESGEGFSGEVVALLRDADITAFPLLDTEVESGARDAWEPRLALYRDAVIVQPQDLDGALDVCSKLPGAELVPGEDGDVLPDGIAAAPEGAAGFLTRLATRTTPEVQPTRARDNELGLIVIGGFDSPLAGRAARAERARLALNNAVEELDRKSEGVRLASLAVESAEADLARARASQQLVPAQEQMSAAEEAVAQASKAVDELVHPLEQSEAARAEAATRVASHDVAVQAAEERLNRRRVERDHTTEELRVNRRSLQALQVDYWRRSWGETPEAAEAALTDEPRTEKRLRNRASEALNEALLALDIKSSGEGAPNDELREAARRRSQLSDDGEDGRPPTASFDEVAKPLRDLLDTHEDNDRITADRIATSRERREQELELAERESTELHDDLSALQDAVEQRIRQALEAIGAEYDRLNQESNRFGADLLIEPTRPESPQDRWRWAVTPRWRRSPNGRLLPYDNQANTAQEKLATVQLVLAALLAAPNPRGRVLVLDELGDSLGLTHRREVLREIAETATAKGVTVLGTCQDSVLNDAASFCGELLYFEYPSLTEALNRPTRMFGFDENGQRVELTADALTDGRQWL